MCIFIFDCAKALWLHWLFLVVIPGFSRQRLLLLWSTGSGVHGFSGCGCRAPEHRLSGWGAGALVPLGVWDLPGSGIEPVFPALAGEFFTTEPSGKPRYSLFNRLQTSLSFYQFLGSCVCVCVCVCVCSSK